MSDSLALAAPNPIRAPAEVFRRQPVLAALGVFYAAALIPTLWLASVDPRALDGAEVWDKPVKFLMSLSVYSLTAAWFFGYVDRDARRGPTGRWTVWSIVISSLFEMAYIALQASRAERSHFNIADPVHGIMYALMGVGALFLVGASLPLAWLIARRPAEGLRAPYRDALVLGLVMTVALGGGLGGYMSSTLSHWVGPQPTSPGLPFLGWSTTGGDLRPAHFLGIHAEQFLPAFALLVPGRSGRSRAAVWLGAIAYAALTLWVFQRALAGIPLIAM